MREYGSNINLPSLDNLFSSEQERQDAKLEKIQILPLTELHPFRNHPFQVRDDDEMDKMVDSVKEYGVMTPAIVRPRKDGGYEIVAGHRRCHASQRAGVETMPCIVRDIFPSRTLPMHCAEAARLKIANSAFSNISLHRYFLSRKIKPAG